MFLWTSVAHMVLPLGEVGVQEISNEPPVLSAMQSSLGDKSGFYFFPGMGLGPDASSQQKNAAMQQYDQKLAASPSGILIYSPPGRLQMIGRRLTIEFLTELLEAFLVVFLLAQTRLESYTARLAFVAVAGILVSLATNVSYWNWYGFPGNYTASYMITQILGFVCIGAVAAAMIKAPQPQAVAAAA
jgi:hypothetical protein